MNLLKQEKGSITLFVLISMIFFVMFLVGMYMLSANSESSVVAESARIKEIYEQGVDNIDDVYETLTSSLTLSEKITAANYGDYVNYPVDITFPNVDMATLGHKTDWRIFYNDGTYVYLILSYLLPYSEVPSGTAYVGYDGRPYTSYFNSSLTYENTRESLYPIYMMNYKYNDNGILKYEGQYNTRYVSELFKIAWSTKFANTIYAEDAIGAPTIEMWGKSWNEYNIEKNKGWISITPTYNSSEPGYKINNLSYISGLPITDTLYFPIGNSQSDATGYNYWTSSPSDTSNGPVFIYYDGKVGCVTVSGADWSVRPVVRLKAMVGGQTDANGVWQLQ